jgi:hypothetical protein
MLTSWGARVVRQKSTHWTGTCYSGVWMEFEHVSSNALTETGNEKPILLGGYSVMHSAVDENLLFEYPCPCWVRMHPNIQATQD